jgi:hypothetical protein
MTEDLRKDPEFIAWETHVRTNVVPRMQASALTISLAPNGEPDIKYAVELGLSIMLDKPIYLVCEPGQILPDRLSRIADKVIEVDWRNDPIAAQQAIADAIEDFPTPPKGSHA